MLLGLGPSAQLGPGTTPLGKHHRRSCRRRSIAPSSRPLPPPTAAGGWSTEHLHRPLSAERSQSLGLVQRLGVSPSHLEHDIAAGRGRSPAGDPRNRGSPGSNGSPTSSLHRSSINSIRSGGTRAGRAAHAGPPTSTEACKQAGTCSSAIRRRTPPYGFRSTARDARARHAVPQRRLGVTYVSVGIP